MSPRRPRFLPGPFALFLLLALLGLRQAQAGVFDDDEARRQVKDLSNQTNERVDTLSKAQIELANQIQALREENAKLRGQIETLNYELDSTKKRQQDFYVDLDSRLRKLEPMPETGGDPGKSPDAAPENAKKPAADPAAEARDYEKALNLFKANKIKDAAAAFAAFVNQHPGSSLAPNAQYWLGNAHFALHDCKKAIAAHKVVVAKWPQHAKAPDSLLNIATCQQELGDKKGVKATLESVLSKYPGTPAAVTAQQRLKKK